MHDAAEDQGGMATLERIKYEFGTEVANIVANCSDTLETPKPSWVTRKQNYINALPQYSDSTRLVSAADKLDNLRDLTSEYGQFGEKMWEKFSGTRDQTVWYYRSLIEIYMKYGPQRLGQEVKAQLDLLEHQFTINNN